MSAGYLRHLEDRVFLLKKQRKVLRKRLRAAKRQIERQGLYIKELKARRGDQ